MAAWFGMDGKTYHEVEVAHYATEAEARAAAEAAGASYHDSRMAGLFYRGNGRSFHISRSSWQSGRFCLYEVVEKK
jgi:hypothetical protein